VLVTAQIAILIVLVVGWGYWTWRFLLGRQATFPFAWLFAGLAGYVGQLLMLDTTTRLGVPVRVSAWPLLTLAVLGVASAAGPLRRGWTAASTRARKEILATICIFSLIFAIQGAGVVHQGPQNYYGKGRTDQLAWVTLGQYLLERGFPDDSPDMQRHPWTVKAVAMGGQRMISAVANAELAVASWSDVKSAYGVQSVFFAALLATCVFVVLRGFSVWRPLALTGSLWVGILPSLTKIHLDAFFAQVSMLFVFPLLVAAARYRLDRDWRGLFLITLYVSYLFGAYTDFYPFALVLLVLLFACPWPQRNASWMLRLGLVVLMSLLLNALYLHRGLALFLDHLRAAGERPPALEVLFPAAGTALGWSDALFGLLPVEPRLAYRVAVWCILGAGLISISAFFSRSLRNRYHLVAAVAAPLGYLCVLASGGGYPTYPYWKVSHSFAWLLAALVVLGVYRLALLMVHRKQARVITLLALCGLVVLSLVGYAQEMSGVVGGGEALAILNGPALRAAYRYLDSHPGSTVLIQEPNPIVVGWLSYHGRTSAIHVDRFLLEGDYLPPGDWPFYAAPMDMDTALVADSHGLKPACTRSSSPSVAVRNQQGVDWDDTGVWYWMGDGLDFLIAAPDGENGRQQWILEFVASPGPGNPMPWRRLVLTSAETPDVIVDILGREMVRIPVKLTKGPTIVHLRGLWPTEQTEWVPNDPRKLMVRISNVALREARP
jgi:hypothetical protein